MTVIEASSFSKAYDLLPTTIQTSYQHQKRVFETNWRDTRLHVKKLLGLDDVYSFRVTRGYRVLFYFQGDRIVVFFMIAHRKDAYKRR